MRPVKNYEIIKAVVGVAIRLLLQKESDKKSH